MSRLRESGITSFSARTSMIKTTPHTSLNYSSGLRRKSLSVKNYLLKIGLVSNLRREEQRTEEKRTAKQSLKENDF